jgi:ubiquitin C-terminal hydrolase
MIYIRETIQYLSMTYNQYKGNRQCFSSNENNNDYYYKNYHKNGFTKYNNHQKYKNAKKYVFQEESKLNSKNDFLQEKYGGISSEDYITNEDYNLLLEDMEKLKNENKNIKELKEKFEQEIKKLKNYLKEKEKKEKDFKSEIKEIEKLKSENKNMKELKEKLEQEIQKLKNNMKEKENEENKINAENKEYEELKNENKNLKELKEKLEQEMQKLKNNMKVKENEENKVNAINKKYEELKNENKNLKELKENFEQEIEKIKNNLKEKENTFKAEIKNNQKLIKNFKTEKNKYELQIKEKEKEINKLKIDKENILNELRITQKENKSYIDEINKQNELINNLEKKNLYFEKSFENEKKKNDELEKLIKGKNEKILYYGNKFEQIKNIMSDINLLNENKTEDREINKNMSFNKEENINREEEEHNKNSIRIKNGNGKVGIFNKELNCYMSSVIQILKNIKEFSEVILNIENLNDDILSSLQNLIYSLYYSKKKSIYITEFKTSFSKIYTRFEGRNSNDSTFFLIYLFSYLQKILPSSKKSSTNLSEFSFLNLNNKELEGLKKFLEKFESKNNSFIHDLFYYFQMSELICSGCNEAKVSFQGNNVLFLSIKDGKTELNSLEQCINSYLYTKDKKDDKDFTCSSCGRQTISHVMSLVKLPPILIINLKKVGDNSLYTHDIDIPFRLKTRDIEKLKKFNMEYELIGFIKHYGSADDGHNIAYTKNIFDQKWYEFNDSKVELIKGYPQTDKAFLLFYQIIH